MLSISGFDFSALQGLGFQFSGLNLESQGVGSRA